MSKGFETVGYDASRGLLAEARKLHPGIDFCQAALPELDAIGDQTFENVLCETVIMHLPADAIAPSVRRLMSLLRPGGTLYLSWRVTEGDDQRLDDGRLYTSFPPSLVLDATGSAVVVHDSESTSASSGRTVHRLVVRKSDAVIAGKT
jgi:SAM-dependent methyltransferase